MNNNGQQLNSKFVYDKNTVLERHDLVYLSNADEDLVILDEEENHYFTINSVGYKIWGLLESKKTVEQLVSGLMSIYNVDFDTCFRDINVFIQTMIEQNLIKVCHTIE